MAGIGFRTVAELPHLPVGASGRFSERLFRAVGLSFLVVVPGARASNKGCLEMSFAAYLELLKWSGRQWRADKRGAIPGNLPLVFERLEMPEAGWMELLRGFDGRFRRVAGCPESMAQEAAKRGRRNLHGMPTSRAAYGGQSSRSSTDKT